MALPDCWDASFENTAHIDHSNTDRCTYRHHRTKAAPNVFSWRIPTCHRVIQTGNALFCFHRRLRGSKETRTRTCVRTIAQRRSFLDLHLCAARRPIGKARLGSNMFVHSARDFDSAPEPSCSSSPSCMMRWTIDIIPYGTCLALCRVFDNAATLRTCPPELSDDNSMIEMVSLRCTLQPSFSQLHELSSATTVQYRHPSLH